jgi:hypothetical protein
VTGKEDTRPAPVVRTEVVHKAPSLELTFPDSVVPSQAHDTVAAAAAVDVAQEEEKELAGERPPHRTDCCSQSVPRRRRQTPRSPSGAVAVALQQKDLAA